MILLICRLDKSVWIRISQITLNKTRQRGKAKRREDCGRLPRASSPGRTITSGTFHEEWARWHGSGAGLSHKLAGRVGSRLCCFVNDWMVLAGFEQSLLNIAKSAKTILTSVLTPLKQEIAYLEVGKKCSKQSGQAITLPPIPHICHFFYTGKIFGK